MSNKKKKEQAQPKVPNGARVIVWDIEATDLAANHGVILCICAKVAGQKTMHKWRLDSYTGDVVDDAERCLIAEASEFLDSADLHVTHYGSKFDVPFVNTRALYHALPSLAPVPHVDTWRVARYQMKLNNNRLQTVTEFFGGADKTRLDGINAMKAFAGNKRAMDDIVKHCEIDVEVLENAYFKMRPVIRNHPNITIGKFPAHEGEHCPACGSDKLARRGYRVARTARYQRYQCNSCGHWSSGPSERYHSRGVRVAR
jgi:uncharacterized protein YprB with RNaseH-like and TPR domain/predicted RNA-binding Zn-ribbon protein involved in translation (DUF1610 family)